MNEQKTPFLNTSPNCQNNHKKEGVLWKATYFFKLPMSCVFLSAALTSMIHDPNFHTGRGHLPW
jgi:hypothetical protein